MLTPAIGTGEATDSVALCLGCHGSLMVMALLLEKTGEIEKAQVFEQKALNECEKELRDYLSGIKNVASFEDDQDVSVTRLGVML